MKITLLFFPLLFLLCTTPPPVDPTPHKATAARENHSPQEKPTPDAEGKPHPPHHTTLIVETATETKGVQKEKRPTPPRKEATPPPNVPPKQPTPLMGTLALLGDIMLTKGAARMVDEKGPSYPFALIKGRLAKYEKRFANLEVPITNATKVLLKKKRWTFKATPKQALALLPLKLDLVSLANNHLLDFGRRGLFETIAFLRQHHIPYAGAGNNKAAARAPLRFTLGGIPAKLLAYNERPPKIYFATKRRPGTARLHPPAVRYDVKKHRAPGTLLFVSLHWGKEHTDRPQRYQIRRAHKLIDLGADAVIGHHPHRPQSIEIYKGKPIIYSLGNLISGFQNPLYRDNIGVVLHYKGTTLLYLEVLFLTGDMYHTGFRPQFVTKGSRFQKNVAHIKAISKRFQLKTRVKGDALLILP